MARIGEEEEEERKRAAPQTDMDPRPLRRQAMRIPAGAAAAIPVENGGSGVLTSGFKLSGRRLLRFAARLLRRIGSSDDGDQRRCN